MFTQDQLAVVTEVGEGGLARVSIPADTADGKSNGAPDLSRFFGFALPHTTTPAEPPQPPVAIVAPAPKPAVRPLPTTPVVNVVTPVHAPAAPLAPPRERPRHEIARDIQRELKRVGCYAGEIDGNWGAGSRRAAKTFMERINSTLPTDEPDLVQLTMIRGFSGTACAAPCPPDRTVPGSSRCLPTPVIAGRAPTRPLETGTVAAQSTTPIVTGSTQQAYAAAPAAAPAPISVVPLDGRMSVGAPPATVAGMLAAPAAGTGVAIAPPPHRADHEVKRVRPVRKRQDRSWTATFFDR
jgi:hypothetical protein